MEEELETKLLVDVARLDPEGETLEGEVDIIDLDEPFVKPFGGVRYRLTATSHLSVSDDPRRALNSGILSSSDRPGKAAVPLLHVAKRD